MLIGLRRAGAGLLLVMTMATAMSSASAATVPFVDRNVDGFVALCDLAGNNVTGGSVHTKPLVWKAVSSVAAPAAYRGSGESAALFIYQVRKDVPPAYWSGDELSAASFYTNRRHPAAQLTYRDFSLADIIGEFPPMYDGLYQLRMKVGKLNYATYDDTYPATVIRVTGGTWRVVQGGTLPCGRTTKAKSAELFAGRSQVAPHPGEDQTPPTAPPSLRVATGALRRPAGAAEPVVSSAHPRSSHRVADVLGVIALAGFVAGGAFLARRGATRTP